MDGRPHPSKNAPHTAGGFTTGVWQGGMLAAQTTHLKTGLVWRNGVPHSDQATMTEYYVRHGDLLTITMILDDPIYYEEPFIRNATFELDPQTRVLPEPCEPQVEIPRTPGEVPHYLPGENPYLTRVRGAVQPAARGRSRRRRDDVSGVREEAESDLQAAGEVHGLLLRRHRAHGAEHEQRRLSRGRRTTNAVIQNAEFRLQTKRAAKSSASAILNSEFPQALRQRQRDELARMLAP